MKAIWMAGLLAVFAVVTIGLTEPQKLTGQEPVPDLPKLSLHDKRTSTTDLALSGNLPGSSVYAGKFISLVELQRLTQVTFTVTDDPNFPERTELSGVSLEELMQALQVPEKNTLVAAICDDQYEGHYSAEYRAAHHPILVLAMNGKPLAMSKRTADGGTYGPYLISHRTFVSRYRTLGQPEEAQIPNGVLGLSFLNETEVLGAIHPRGNYGADSPQMQGYVIAEENCFRCHNAGDYGGHKAGITWNALARVARNKPAFFGAYIKEPESENAYSEMPGFPEYDDATLAALTAYFQTFAVNAASK